MASISTLASSSEQLRYSEKHSYWHFSAIANSPRGLNNATFER